MSTYNAEQAKSASQIVAEARQTVPELTVVQAKEELEQGQAGLLLDVREPAEWEKGHIPGVTGPARYAGVVCRPNHALRQTRTHDTTRCSHHRHVCVGRTLDAGRPNPQEDGLYRRGEHGWGLQ